MKKLLNRLPSPMGRTHDELVETLLREEYGYLPARPYSVTAEEIKRDKSFAAGKADLVTLSLTCKADFGEYSFPVYYVCPKEAEGPVPCFIHINFRDLIPDRYQPTEEIIDQGYATLTFCYHDVTRDNGDFTDGLAGVVYPEGNRPYGACGKIGLWAWAAMALMDYASTLPELDHGRITVVGHSRLGKTALLTGALDGRFYCAISNDSGCSGAAIAREKTGERIANIMERFPYWFSETYAKYIEGEEALPFDQHWLIAANAPHKVYVASAVEDTWACPEKEFLACIAASEYYEALTGTGFIHTGSRPSTKRRHHGGNIGYHMRRGTHYLSREDWNNFIKFLNR